MFSVGYNAIDSNNVLDIHRYLMKGTGYKTMFRFTKKMFIVLLNSLVIASHHAK